MCYSPNPPPPHLNSQHNLHYSPLPRRSFCFASRREPRFFSDMRDTLASRTSPLPCPCVRPPWLPPTLAAWVNKQCKIIQKFHGAHSDKAADKPPDRVNKGWRRVCRESKVGVNHTPSCPLFPLSPCFPGSDPGPCAPISKFLSFRLLNHYEMSLSIRGNVFPSLPPPPLPLPSNNCGWLLWLCQLN